MEEGELAEEDFEEAWSSPPPGLDDAPGLEGGSWLEQEAFAAELASAHQAHALSSAVANANVAAQHAAQLAQYVTYLQTMLYSLRDRVSELEQWKKTALEDVRKLREDHKVLRRKLAGIEEREEVPLPPKSRSAPQMSEEAAAAAAAASEAPVEETPALGLGSLPHGFSLNSLAGLDLDADGPLEGITVVEGLVDDAPCVRAEWRIGNLSTKLRGCKGRALVSSPFAAAGLEDLRLMVCPDARDASGSDRRSRVQKELYVKKVTEGPLDAALRLKAPSAAPSSSTCREEIRYYLKVGFKRMGPFRHNFTESTLSGCEAFGVDWLTHLDPDLSLLVCLEILVPGSGGDGGVVPLEPVAS